MTYSSPRPTASHTVAIAGCFATQAHSRALRRNSTALVMCMPFTMQPPRYRCRSITLLQKTCHCEHVQSIHMVGPPPRNSIGGSCKMLRQFGEGIRRVFNDQPLHPCGWISATTSCAPLSPRPTASRRSSLIGAPMRRRCLSICGDREHKPQTRHAAGVGAQNPDGLRLPELRDRHIRMRIESLFPVARGAVLVARYLAKRKYEQQPECPADQDQHNPAKVHARHRIVATMRARICRLADWVCAVPNLAPPVERRPARSISRISYAPNA